MPAGAHSVVADKLSDLPISETTPTALRLRFLGGQRAPEEVRSENILSWYVFWSGDVTLTERDKEGKVLTQTNFPKTWMILVIFNKPVHMRQVIVEPAMPNFPRYEVKFRNPIYTIISTFGDDPPPGNLDIYLKN